VAMGDEKTCVDNNTVDNLLCIQVSSRSSSAMLELDMCLFFKKTTLGFNGLALLIDDFVQVSM
jgi:hypothetical protein